MQNECNGNFGFWGSILVDIGCPFYNVCENAGDQVTNCMSSNACSSNDNSIWHGVRDNPGATARSISPDHLRGIYSASTDSWAADQAYHQVQWNAPGAQYGCWN